MTTARLKVGIVGCGKIAINHAKALHAMPEVELVACSDTSKERADSFAAAHGIAHAYDDLEALLGSGLDAVTICTPHPTHEAIVIAAAEHGLHVLCEKPIAITLDEADRMVEATAAAGVKFGVLFQRRFWPAAQRIRTAIDAGDLGGAPIVATCTVRLGRDLEYYTSDPWRGRWDTDGGGVLMTQAIHYIDMLQWFMGDAVEVTGHVDTLVHGDYIEVEDTVAATVKFSSGGLATITAGTTFAPGLGTQIVVGGRNGHTVSLTEFPEGTPAVNDIWTVAGEEEYRQMHSTAIESDPPLSKIHVGLVPFHQMQIEDFVHAIVEDRAPAVSGRDARRALEIVLAIYESSRTGQPVTLTSGALAGLQ
ncbi:oxidoreductase [Rhodococcus sp. SC4]|uniref:Gfo/Idh/MocA family protein n=1 Tax=Rhodococcus sp. LB1 TaxID=1807499 RepID=UPI00076A03EF|nr:Gfo/Idh/MocA family oxidoreductase [Rhodococcus sp. LB1]KXF50644.1 oxidoreductase [Rhodococcus sp. SC4]KXX61096.1 oxidoreductase [Rhodococcus sp. LB1]